MPFGGMLDKLDPHSTYTTAEETREMNEPLQGNFSGVGIQFNMNKRYVVCDTDYRWRTFGKGGNIGG